MNILMERYITACRKGDTHRAHIALKAMNRIKHYIVTEHETLKLIQK